jgi:hypothetical protein
MRIHLVPINGLHDMDFDNAAQDSNPAELDRAAGTIRRKLARLGFDEVAN